MLNLNEQEQHYLNLAQHIDLSEIDYPTIMSDQVRHTYIYLGAGGSIFIVAFVFFIGELLPNVKGIGAGVVSIMLLIALFCFFHAMRYQKEMETRVTYEILQKIHAIEGKNGFLWRINAIINAYCIEEYGGLPEEVQQLQISSQSGGIEMSEIRLYKDLLEKAILWYEKQDKQ